LVEPELGQGVEAPDLVEVDWVDVDDFVDGELELGQGVEAPDLVKVDWVDVDDFVDGELELGQGVEAPDLVEVDWVDEEPDVVGHGVLDPEVKSDEIESNTDENTDLDPLDLDELGHGVEILSSLSSAAITVPAEST
jgi:hypothetical protein